MKDLPKEFIEKINKRVTTAFLAPDDEKIKKISDINCDLFDILVSNFYYYYKIPEDVIVRIYNASFRKLLKPYVYNPARNNFFQSLSSLMVEAINEYNDKIFYEKKINMLESKISSQVLKEDIPINKFVDRQMEIYKAIHELEDNEKQIVLLKDIVRMPIDFIAEQLSLDYQECTKNYHSAISKINSYLEKKNLL